MRQPQLRRLDFSHNAVKKLHIETFSPIIKRLFTILKSVILAVQLGRILVAYFSFFSQKNLMTIFVAISETQIFKK